MTVPTSRRLEGAPPAAVAAGGDDDGHRRITAKQRRRLEDAILSGIRRILASSRALHRTGSALGPRDSDGLLAVAAGLYTYAFEEYGKLLLMERLPEKGGVVSVPYREIFRSHGKKFEAASEALPKECWSAEAGYFDPAYFDPAYFDTWGSLEATFPVRVSMFYLDMDSNGEPVVPIPMKAALLENALAGMEQAVGEWEGRNRPAGPDCGEARGGREAT